MINSSNIYAKQDTKKNDTDNVNVCGKKDTNKNEESTNENDNDNDSEAGDDDDNDSKADDDDDNDSETDNDSKADDNDSVNKDFPNLCDRTINNLIIIGKIREEILNNNSEINELAKQKICLEMIFY